MVVGIVQNAHITDYDDNKFTQYIEENTGIDLEFEYYSSNSSEYVQQLTLRAASSDKLISLMFSITENLIDFYALFHQYISNYTITIFVRQPEFAGCDIKKL